MKQSSILSIECQSPMKASDTSAHKFVKMWK